MKWDNPLASRSGTRTPPEYFPSDTISKIRKKKCIVNPVFLLDF